MKKEKELKTENGIYKINGKEYGLAPELVKGGCQGCAFYNRMDCAEQGRAKVCNAEHKIFKRLINHQ